MKRLESKVGAEGWISDAGEGNLADGLKPRLPIAVVSIQEDATVVVSTTDNKQWCLHKSWVDVGYEFESKGTWLHESRPEVQFYLNCLYSDFSRDAVVESLKEQWGEYHARLLNTLLWLTNRNVHRPFPAMG